MVLKMTWGFRWNGSLLGWPGSELEPCSNQDKKNGLDVLHKGEKRGFWLQADSWLSEIDVWTLYKVPIYFQNYYQ